MFDYLKNLFSKPQIKENEEKIITLENKCDECGAKLCYDKNSLKEVTGLHSEADVYCSKCGHDRYYIQVSENMVQVFHKK